MTLIAGAVIWVGYTIVWWGWEAMTDRVPSGTPGTIWWPSIRDLVVPGRVTRAVPAKLNPPNNPAKTGDSTGTNVAAASLLDSSTAAAPTVGSGAGDTGSITSGASAKVP